MGPPLKIPFLQRVGGVSSLLAILGLVLFFAASPTLPDEAGSFEGYQMESVLQDLQLIAAAPHPVGSSHHEKVLNYIRARCASNGVKTSVQTASLVQTNSSVMATVQNLIVELPGEDSRSAILIVGHYDTVRYGPGATDNSVAVANMLEAIRIMAPRALKQSLIFLFTDAEELGLLGAKAFLEQHPLAERVSFVANFDSRGSAGRQILFQTRGVTPAILRGLFADARRVVVNSFAEEVYRGLRHETDFSEFERRGIPGLNFANIEKSENYHNALDRPPNVSRSTILDQARCMISCCTLAERGIPGGETKDILLFTAGGIPFCWDRAPLLGVSGGVILLGIVGTAWRNRDSRTFITGLKGLAICVLVVLTAMAIGYGTEKLFIPQIVNSFSLRWMGSHLYQLFFLFALSAAALTLGIWTRRGLPGAVGASVLWTLATAALFSQSANAGSILMAGLAFRWLGTLLASLTPRRDLAAWAEVTLSLPLFFTVADILYLFHEAVGFRLLTVTFGGGALLMLLFLPLLNYSLRGSGPAPLAGVMAITLGASIWLSRQPVPRPETPVMNTLTFLQRAGTKACWISPDRAPDAWTSRTLGPALDRELVADILPWETSRTFLRAEADVLPLSPPRATLVEDKTAGGKRELTVEIASDRGAAVLFARVEWPQVSYALEVNGMPCVADSRTLAPHTWIVQYWNVPREGLRLRLTGAGATPVTIFLLDQEYGLPGDLSRPDSYIMAPYPFTDMTLIAADYSF